MQRKYSEPNTYIDNPRGGRSQQEDLYDDVDMSDAVVSEAIEGTRAGGELLQVYTQVLHRAF